MPRRPVHSLSPREAEILQLASNGLTDSGIAHRLDISEGSVGTYWGRIRTKLGPYPRTELIAISIRSELQLKLDSLTEERDRLAEQLHQTHDHEVLYEEVIDGAYVGVILVDCAGIIEHANPVAHQIFGYSPRELQGRPLTQLVPERYRQTHLTQFQEFCQRPDNRSLHPHLEALGIHKNGSEIPISISISAVELGDEILLTGYFHLRDTVSTSPDGE